MDMRLVIVSDTHGFHDRISVPAGDILVHAGDVTWRGEAEQLQKFAAWLHQQPHPHKIVVAGNHDRIFEDDPAWARKILGDCIYLQDSGTTLHGLNFWGSPWQPEYKNWAFNLPCGSALRDKWDLIPSDTDILITHGPPGGILDLAHDEHLGCTDLLEAVRRIRPRAHIFGHVHEGYGHLADECTQFVNASICKLWFRRYNAPLVLHCTDFGIDVEGGASAMEERRSATVVAPAMSPPRSTASGVSFRTAW